MSNTSNEDRKAKITVMMSVIESHVLILANNGGLTDDQTKELMELTRAFKVILNL